MIIKLLCWLYGHKIVVKAYTGQTMKAQNGLGEDRMVSMYLYETKPFCVRCGKKNEKA